MQQPPHDEGLRWIVGLALPSFVLGIGWLVKRFAARKSEYVQLGLAQAQTDEIRARVKRDDESAEFTRMRVLSESAWATADKLRQERDAGDARVGQLLIERREQNERIERLEEQLRMAEEELGLKSRSERS